MQYKITAVNEAKGFVSLLVDFEDGTTRAKNMMADVSNLASIDGAVQAWWSDYEPMYEADKLKPKPESAIASAVAAGTFFKVASKPVEKLDTAEEPTD